MGNMELKVSKKLFLLMSEIMEVKKCDHAAYPAL